MQVQIDTNKWVDLAHLCVYMRSLDDYSLAREGFLKSVTHGRPRPWYEALHVEMNELELNVCKDPEMARKALIHQARTFFQVQKMDAILPATAEEMAAVGLD